MQFKKYEEIEKLFGKEEAIAIRDNLCTSKYILSKVGTKFRSTVLSKSVRKLLGISKENINFDEWYIIYPPKVGTRVFTTKATGTVTYNKLKAKYLLHVKTIEDHEIAVRGTEAMVAMHRRGGKLDFLPDPSRVINNQEWEKYADVAPVHTNVKVL